MTNTSQVARSASLRLSSDSLSGVSNDIRWNRFSPFLNAFTSISGTYPNQLLHGISTALCIFGKRGPKMFNFELLILHGFSSKNREILHKAVLTPQESKDYFFEKK